MRRKPTKPPIYPFVILGIAVSLPALIGLAYKLLHRVAW